jgi:hypothetical protein
MVVVAPADYPLVPMLNSLRSSTTGCSTKLDIVHPHDHTELTSALASADCVLWVWAPDKVSLCALAEPKRARVQLQ